MLRRDARAGELRLLLASLAVGATIGPVPIIPLDPSAVPAGLRDDPGAGAVEDLEHLLLVGLRRRLHRRAGELRAGRRATAGIADHGGEVTDDEDRGVAEVLELAQLGEADGVTEMDVRPRWVEPQFGAQRLAAGHALFDFGEHFGFDEQFVAAALHDVELLLGGEIGEGHDGRVGGDACGQGLDTIAAIFAFRGLRPCC